MHYRREIDGLRALAVVPVILFHAGFGAFSGGFVGVDVFFVISGYLITTIILAELEHGRFSIVGFYERRARRILPALFVVMMACIPFAWLWLVPREMKDFAESLMAASLFLSNHLFLSEKGYFDTAAELKPLLHTWSLAVEEQYYLLFPLFLMALWRLGRRWVLLALSLVFITSLALAQWASHAQPLAAFFLLPTRAWELMIGAFAALHLSRVDHAGGGRGTHEIGGWLGIALIGYAVLVYSEATPVPGFYALVPTVGAVLIILFATQQTTAGRFLGHKVFVGLGLISYSAYLWHQPLFAFARHSKLVGSGFAYLALSLLAIVLGYLSWRFVETPFRQKQKITRRPVFVFSAAGLLFFSVIGAIGHAHNGFPKDAPLAAITTERRTDRNFIVLGDSHGGHIVSGLRAITSGRVTDHTVMGCIPFRNVDGYDSRSVPGECVARVNKALDQATAEDTGAVVVFSFMGPVYLEGTAFNGKDMARVTGQVAELVTDKSVKDKRKIFEAGLRSTLRELTKLKNSTIVFAIDVPELGIDYGCDTPQKELALGMYRLPDLIEKIPPEACFVARSTYDERIKAYKAFVARVLLDFPSVRLFDPTDEFCTPDRCKGFDARYGYLYHDADHLSSDGSRFFAVRLVEFLTP